MARLIHVNKAIVINVGTVNGNEWLYIRFGNGNVFIWSIRMVMNMSFPFLAFGM